MKSLALGAERRPGDPTLERFEIETRSLGEVGEPPMSRLYAGLMAFGDDRRHLA